ncbi:hypothetical protein BKA93DRAFT_63524 [Sparassis latifolia]|uniref:Uncharacterized protein n=1 Tax=Sparassis crispa TaxID=139825 RepID=A0A401GPS0_9APHY|nr:hypothetical protein SCP_0601950 [Sparassis crispa]GBE84217.1 hypothetical protein SCP_0601950 [Sparassis crispa]
MTSLQSDTGRSLVRAGIILQLCGLIWGFAVQGTPFPRLGLTAHIQCMLIGNMLIVYGLILHQPGLVSLKFGTLQVKIIQWGMLAVYITMASEMLNAFWGTNQMLPQAAKAAGAVGGLPWQEQLVTFAHMFPSFTLIAAVTAVVVGMGGREQAKKTA